MIVAVDVCPNRRIPVDVFAATAVAQNRAMSFDQNQRFMIGCAPIAHVREWMPDKLLVSINQRLCVPFAHRILVRSGCRKNKPRRSFNEGGSAAISLSVSHSVIGFAVG